MNTGIVSAEAGLRERKKQRTRQLIADTAHRLFADRGFDHVTVTAIAREAEVSEKTVYNYFPTKEDLFYHRLEAFENELLAAIRGRSPGESALAALRRFLIEPRGVLAKLDARQTHEAREQLRTITRIITGSPALLAREQRAFAEYTDELAALIAEETRSRGDRVEPWVAANALMGVHRALIDFVRRRTLAGDDEPRELARAVRAQAEQAFARLEVGLGKYAEARPEALSMRTTTSASTKRR
jgi:AcrR family transcriptional regulator